MWCYWIEGSKVMLQLVKIAVGCGVTLIMIKSIEVDAFGVDFILVVVIVAGPLKNNISTTFNVTAGEDTTLDSVD